MKPDEIVSRKLNQLANQFTFTRLTNQTQTQISQSLLLEINMHYDDNPHNTKTVLRKLISHTESSHKKKLLIGYFIATTAILMLLLNYKERAPLIFALAIVLGLPAAITGNSLAYESSLADAKNVLTDEEQKDFNVTLNFLRTGWKPQVADSALRYSGNLYQLHREITSDPPQVRKMFVVSILREYLAAIETCEHAADITHNLAR